MSGVRVQVIGDEIVAAALYRVDRASRFRWPNTLMDEAGRLVVDVVKENCPVKDGDLRDSVVMRNLPDTRIIEVESEHAVYQNEGTAPSPGRYIPAIGKRYKNDPEHLAARGGFKIGLESSPVPYEVEWIKDSGSIPGYSVWGLFTPSEKHVMTSYMNELGMKKSAMEVHLDVARRRTGPKFDISRIQVATFGRHKSDILRTATHEIAHAMQLNQYGMKKMFDRGNDEWIEEQAHGAAEIVYDIGMHPGQTKNVGFFERALAQAMMELQKMLPEKLRSQIQSVWGGNE